MAIPAQFCVVNVEKVLWMKSSWGCITILCTQRNLLNALTVVKRARSFAPNEI